MHYSKYSALVAASLISMVLFENAAVKGQEFRLVSPNEFTDREADGSSDQLVCCPFSFRYQQLFPASDFSDLPAEKRLLTSIAWRPDGQAVTGPRSADLGPAVLRISTTTNSVLSDVFEDNVVPDAVTVLNKRIIIETANRGPEGGPKEFDYVVQLDTPYRYDPSQGNLLFDWVFTEGFPAPAHLSDSYTESFRTDSVRFATPMDMPSGSFVPGLIHEFTFVPEPSSFTLVAFGAVAALILRRSLTAQPQAP